MNVIYKLCNISSILILSSIILFGFGDATIVEQTKVDPIILSEVDTTPLTCIEPVEVKYPLTESERRVVECMVMGEARGESYEGKVLVAQCILNACIIDDLQPSEVRTQFKYSGWHDNPNDEVKLAVSEVFDNGYTITDEPILYFYAPKYSKGGFHETQRYILTEGGHKFFARWE